MSVSSGYRRKQDAEKTPLGALIARLQEISEESSSGCWIIKNKLNVAGLAHFTYQQQSRTFASHLRRALEATTGKKFPPHTRGIRTKCFNLRCINPRHVEFMTWAEALRVINPMKKKKEGLEQKARGVAPVPSK